MEIPRVFVTGPSGTNRETPRQRGADLPMGGVQALGQFLDQQLVDKKMDAAARTLEVEKIMTQLQDERAAYERKLLENPDAKTHMDNVRANLSELRQKYIDGISNPEVRLHARTAFERLSQQAIPLAWKESRRIELDSWRTQFKQTTDRQVNLLIGAEDDEQAEIAETNYRAKINEYAKHGTLTPAEIAGAEGKIQDAWYKRYYGMAKQSPEGYERLLRAGLINERKMDADKAAAIRVYAAGAAQRIAELNVRMEEKADKEAQRSDEREQGRMVTDLIQSLRSGRQSVDQVEATLEGYQQTDMLEPKEYDRARAFLDSWRNRDKEPGDPVLAGQIKAQIALDVKGVRLAEIQLSKTLNGHEKAELVQMYDQKLRQQDWSDTQPFKDGRLAVGRLLGEPPGAFVSMLAPVANSQVDILRHRARMEFTDAFSQRYKDERSVLQDGDRARQFADQLANKIAADYRQRYPGTFTPEKVQPAPKAPGAEPKQGPQQPPKQGAAPAPKPSTNPAAAERETLMRRLEIIGNSMLDMVKGRSGRNQGDQTPQMEP